MCSTPAHGRKRSPSLGHAFARLVSTRLVRGSQPEASRVTHRSGTSRVPRGLGTYERSATPSPQSRSHRMANSSQPVVVTAPSRSGKRRPEHCRPRSTPFGARSWRSSSPRFPSSLSLRAPMEQSSSQTPRWGCPSQYSRAREVSLGQRTLIQLRAASSVRVGTEQRWCGMRPRRIVAGARCRSATTVASARVSIQTVGFSPSAAGTTTPACGILRATSSSQSCRA